MTTHKQTKVHPDYDLWKGMRSRCNNPNHGRYADYGGRGITVCARWNDFLAFVEDMGPRPPGASLDRIDRDGNYEPDNCRWADDAQQRRNRRDNVWLTHGGRTMILEDWAAELGVTQRALSARRARGWTDEQILTTPMRRTSRTISTGSL